MLDSIKKTNMDEIKGNQSQTIYSLANRALIYDQPIKIFDDAVLDQKIIPPPKMSKKTIIVKSVIKKEARDVDRTGSGDRTRSVTTCGSQRASLGKYT